MSNNIKALKAGVWYTISNFLLRGMGLLFTPIFTRILTQNEYGEFSSFSSLVSVLLVIVTLNLESTLISAKYDYAQNFDDYIFSSLILSTLSGLLWFLIVNIIVSVNGSLFGLNRFYVNCMMVYFIFYPVVSFYQMRERYFFQYKTSVTINWVLSSSTIILSIILIFILSNSLTGRIIGYVTPTIFIGVVLYISFIKKGSRIQFRNWKYAIRICLPYIPHVLSLTLLNSMDRVMISLLRNTIETALYSLAYNIGAIVTLLIISMNRAFCSLAW